MTHRRHQTRISHRERAHFFDAWASLSTLIAVLVPLTALGIVAWSAAQATFTSHDWVLAALICVLAAASSGAAVWAHGVFADAAERERELHWLRDYRSREVAR